MIRNGILIIGAVRIKLSEIICWRAMDETQSYNIDRTVFFIRFVLRNRSEVTVYIGDYVYSSGCDEHGSEIESILNEKFRVYDDLLMDYFGSEVINGK